LTIDAFVQSEALKTFNTNEDLKPTASNDVFLWNWKTTLVSKTRHLCNKI